MRLDPDAVWLYSKTTNLDRNRIQGLRNRIQGFKNNQC